MASTPRVAVVVPAYNEENILAKSALELLGFLQREHLDGYDVIIADNNSTDTTPIIAEQLSRDHGIRHCFVAQRGKGAAVKHTWLAHDGYDVYCFVDADLSAGLAALPVLVTEVQGSGGVAIGSRYIHGAQIKRSFRRETVSKVYRALFRALFHLGVKDPQCGCKAVSRDVRDRIVPCIENDGFFFDTELLVRARASGYAIKEVPVHWTEAPGTTVHLLRDVPGFLKGLVRLAWRYWTGTLSRQRRNGGGRAKG